MLYLIILLVYREFSLFYIYLCINYCLSVKMYIYVYVLYCINYILVYECNIVKCLKFKWYFKIIDRFFKMYCEDFLFEFYIYKCFLFNLKF